MTQLQVSVADYNELRFYEICIKGHLDKQWADWFDGLTFTHENDGTTILHGSLADQSALHGVLSRIRDLNLSLISVKSLSHDRKESKKMNINANKEYAGTVDMPRNKEVKKSESKKPSLFTTIFWKEWRVPFGLVLLSLVPVLAGAVRLTELASSADITPENARFFASPLPVTLHIFSVSLYAILGAFQFAPSLRRRKNTWHRKVGRLLVPFGLVAALSGLWMTHFYALPKNDGEILYGLRLVFGLGMIISIILALLAIRQRNYAQHGAWMTRAYAIALGAGTQVFTHAPWFLFVGIPDEFPRAVLMGAGWVINLTVAEWVIRKKPTRPKLKAPLAVSA